MPLTAGPESWPQTTFALGAMLLVVVLVIAIAATWLEYRRTKLVAHQEDDLRQLVKRYEQLSENTLDAQRRCATDVAELRTRTASIEKILRTVE